MSLAGGQYKALEWMPIAAVVERYGLPLDWLSGRMRTGLLASRLVGRERWLKIESVNRAIEAWWRDEIHAIVGRRDEVDAAAGRLRVVGGKRRDWRAPEARQRDDVGSEVWRALLEALPTCCDCDRPGELVDADGVSRCPSHAAADARPLPLRPALEIVRALAAGDES